MDYFGIIPQTARHNYVVQPEDVAAFQGKVIHPVLSTFVLAREAEWAGRLVLLPLLREGEQGIGTHVNLTHQGPAFPGETVLFEAVPLSMENGELIVQVTATVNGRAVATGTTGQKILPQTVIDKIFSKAKSQA